MALEPPRFGLAEVEVRDFRSIRALAFAPGPMCALVGEASAGKSNLLVAIWALLDPHARPLQPDDAFAGADGGSPAVAASLADGGRLSLDGAAPAGAPPALFLPADLRAGEVVASPPAPSAAARAALELFRRAIAASADTARGPALALVAALEACCTESIRGLVLLVEEPELHLRPQAQRYLYRLLRRFALDGNQVLYSTHAPAFLNVARLEEIAFVERREREGTRVLQPEPITADEEAKVLTEFDAERSELFLARAALLVEGSTEKLVFPHVFTALGADADREGITIVACDGKSKLPLFGRVCRAVGVPFIAVHDRDAPEGREPIPAEQALNALIAAIAGEERTVVLVPDFEGVAGLSGHSHKPRHAWQRFISPAESDIPEPLARAARLALALATDARVQD